METFIGVIGYLAGILSIVTFIPQAIKTVKTKETKHIILSTYIIYNIANFFFLLLGILSIALPVMRPASTTIDIVIWGSTLIIPYTVTIIATNCIIYVKIKNMKTLNKNVTILEE